MAYTEFYCDPVNGSNLNAGSTTDAAAVYTAANGGWNSSTGVFTPASGDPSATVSVGMFASVYLDAATVGVFVGRVTAVDSTTITVSLTVKIGSAPATGANGRTIKVGGAWKGPNGAEKWPLENIASGLKNVAGDIPRYNLRNNAEYDITSGISNSQAGPFVVQGYTTSAGDGGRAIIDAQSNSIIPLRIGANTTEWVDIEVKGSASNYGIHINGQRVLLRRCVSHDHYKSGIIAPYGGFFDECEVYATNSSNTSSEAGFYIAGDSVLVRCVAHDNTGNTTAGFRIVTCNASLNFCISDTNGAVGLRTNVGGLRLLNCDFYNNASDGIKLENEDAGIFTIENCNLFLNGGYGINGSGAGGRVGSVKNCAFGSGTKANTSGTATGLSGLAEIGTVVYTANELPWADAPAGDFTLNGAACRGTGRGSFMQTAAGYGGTVSKPDIGAAARGGTFPAVANTRYGVTYGAAGIEYTGLLEIPNSGTPTGTQDATSDDCVVSGKKYGSPQRTGTAAGGGGYTYGDEDPDYVLTTADGAGHYHPPEAAEVISTATFGADGIVAGTYDVSDVAEGNIIVGASIGGVAGTYPLTATTQAADAAILEAEKAYLLATKTITFGASNVVGTLAVSNVLTAVTGGTFNATNLTNAKILKGTTWGVSLGETGTLEGCVDSTGTNQGTTGLLVAGTFYATGWWDGLAYEAAPDFPAVGNVYNDTVDGEAGTLTFADTTYVLDTAPDYGVAGTGGAKTATLTAAGNVLTGTGAFGVGGTSVTPSYSPDFPDVTSVLTTDTVDGSAGTFDATNLSVGNVIQDVAFGVGLTGTGANLLATHTTYLSLEAGRNSTTAAAGQILSTHSVTIAGVTTNGTYVPIAQANARKTGTPYYGAGGAVDGTCYVPGAADVRKTVSVDATTGTLVGIVDSTGTLHAYGTCSAAQAWTATGIVHDDGTVSTYGIMSDVGYHTSGVLDVSNDYSSLDYAIEAAGGTYHEATTGEVQDGVAFGASSGLTGTYSPGGTFAEGQADQLTTDRAAVGAVAGSILTTVVGLLGTVDGTYVAPVQAGYSALAAGYGAGGLTTGTLAASKIRDATYGTLADGSVLVAAGGAYVDPSDAEVKLGTAVGVSPRAGTWDAVTKTDVVAATWVVVGHDRWTGGAAGEYPTTDTTNAAHQAADLAFLNANLDEMIAANASIRAQYGCNAGTAVVEEHTANQVLKSAGGNYNDDNLSVGNVRPVEFGLSQTGTLANLVATDAAYVALEATRNSKTAGADQILTGYSVTIAGVTTNGTFDEAARNTDPGIANVKDGVTYKILNVSLEGTYESGAGGTYPAAAYVHSDAGAYGPTGVEYTPSLSALANWCLVAGITWPALDEVDGDVAFGPVTGLEYVGTGVNAATIPQIIRDAMKLAPTAGVPAAGSVDKHLDDILEDTGTTLPTQIAALDIGGGTGVYACTWTVNDGTTVLQGATVSFWLAGVLRGTGTTDASGEVSMSLDAGTYTVAISLSGYTFASTTHTVSATASTWTKTFSMTAIVFSPTPDADQVTAWGYVYGPAGTVESGATIVLEQRTAGARQIYDNAPRTLTADGSGLVSAVVWADGSEYRYRRGTGGEWSELFAPEDDEDPDLPNSYRLPGWLGAS